MVAAALAAHADHKFKKAQTLIEKHLTKFPTDGAASALQRITQVGLHQSKSEGGQALESLVATALEAKPISTSAVRPADKLSNTSTLALGPKRPPLANASPFSMRMIRDPAEAGDGIPQIHKSMRYIMGARSGTHEVAVYTQQGTAKIEIVVTGSSEGPLAFFYTLPSEQSSLEFVDYAEGTLYLQAVSWHSGQNEPRSISSLSAMDAKTGKVRWLISDQFDTAPFLLEGAMILWPTNPGKVAGKGRVEWIDAQTGSLVQTTAVPWPITGVEAEGGIYSLRTYDAVYDLKVAGGPAGAANSAGQQASQSDAEKNLELCLTERALDNIAKRDAAALQTTLDALSPMTREHALMDALREESKLIGAARGAMTWDDVPFQAVPEAVGRPAAKQLIDKSVTFEPVTSTNNNVGELGRTLEGEPFYRMHPSMEFEVPHDVPAQLGNETLQGVWPADGHRILAYGSRFLVIAKKKEAIAERILDWGAESDRSSFGNRGVTSAALAGDILVACRQGGALAAWHLPELTALWQTGPGEGCERELVLHNGLVQAHVGDRVIARRITDGSIAGQKTYPSARLMGIRVRNNKVIILGFEMRGRGMRGRF
jgi:hypothetical protein